MDCYNYLISKGFRIWLQDGEFHCVLRKGNNVKFHKKIDSEMTIIPDINKPNIEVFANYIAISLIDLKIA